MLDISLEGWLTTFFVCFGTIIVDFFTFSKLGVVCSLFVPGDTGESSSEQLNGTQRTLGTDTVGITRISFVCFCGGDECEWDINAVKQYLGTAINLILIHNHGTFKVDGYGDARLEMSSTIFRQYSGTETA